MGKIATPPPHSIKLVIKLYKSQKRGGKCPIKKCSSKDNAGKILKL